MNHWKVNKIKPIYKRGSIVLLYVDEGCHGTRRLICKVLSVNKAKVLKDLDDWYTSPLDTYYIDDKEMEIYS